MSRIDEKDEQNIEDIKDVVDAMGEMDEMNRKNELSEMSDKNSKEGVRKWSLVDGWLKRRPKEGYYYHPLENIEDIEVFEKAVERKNFAKALSPERPYTYFTAELYDQENGIRGGGGLGILAADTRRVAEQTKVPFVLVTPFYPREVSQKIVNGRAVDEWKEVDYKKFGFRYIDTVIVKCCGYLCRLDVVEKKFKHTRIVAITEPNFRELYADTSGSDHRLYQEVSLGFGGYAALKLLGLKPAVIQLNEVATFFAALARLDELVKNGMDFYEAVVYTRKHTLYTNHTLVQAAEAEFSLDQFERFVFPNVKSPMVRKWVRDKFTDGRMKLSSITLEIAELKNGVSKLHARVANYRDVAGEKIKFKAITNGIDIHKWVLKDIRDFYEAFGIIDANGLPAEDYKEKVDLISAEEIREFKNKGRRVLNKILKDYPDQNGKTWEFGDDEFLYGFRRRFVDYKRPDMIFWEPEKLVRILEQNNAHYILAGRVHAGDDGMNGKLKAILEMVARDEVLRKRVHYLPDYDEKLAYGLSCGCNVAVNVPIVGLEACGTSWMKDVANLNTLVSTHDGGVADGSMDAYLCVCGENELLSLQERMEEAAEIWRNDFDLELAMRKQLKEFLPVISGARMMKDYLDYLFLK